MLTLLVCVVLLLAVTPGLMLGVGYGGRSIAVRRGFADARPAKQVA